MQQVYFMLVMIYITGSTRASDHSAGHFRTLKVAWSLCEDNAVCLIQQILSGSFLDDVLIVFFSDIQKQISQVTL